MESVSQVIFGDVCGKSEIWVVYQFFEGLEGKNAKTPIRKAVNETEASHYEEMTMDHGPRGISCIMCSPCK